MEPTSKNHPKSRRTSKSKPQQPLDSPNPTTPSSTLNRTNPNHKPHVASKPTDPPPPRIHTLLQTKAMTLSANADSPITSLLLNKNQRLKSNGILVVEMEKQRKMREAKEGSNKTKSNQRDELKLVDLKVKKSSREIDEPKRPSASMIVGGRRRSFCDSRIELGEFFSTAGVKVVAVDMPPFMQIHAVSCARKAYDSMEKLSSRTLALTLKKEFDGVYGPAWHCIVGGSFGSFVTHSVGGFLYFSMDNKLYFLLFKTTVQRAAD